MMNPIKFNNNDKLPKEALIPYKKKQQAMNSIENKQREMLNWLEKEYGERFKDHLYWKQLKAELAALESEQPKEGTELHPVDMEQVTSAKATLTAEEK